jgi:hypothetical protein
LESKKGDDAERANWLLWSQLAGRALRSFGTIQQFYVTSTAYLLRRSLSFKREAMNVKDYIAVFFSTAAFFTSIVTTVMSQREANRGARMQFTDVLARTEATTIDRMAEIRRTCFSSSRQEALALVQSEN